MERAKYFFIILFFWTTLVVVSLLFEFSRIQNEVEHIAKAKARANFNKDQAVRLWAASHGGVYVFVDSITQPNFDLSINERDIETLSGKKLTLINPAYLMRLLNERFSKYYGIIGHITSKKLLRSENKPDDWELKVLNLFEQGIEEVSEYSEINGKPYLRLMRPLFIEQSCLKCHEKQGYQTGDVRGGINVSIPMRPILDWAFQQKKHIFSMLFLLWIVGSTGLIIAFRKLNQVIEKQKQTEIRIKIQNKAFKRANKKLQESEHRYKIFSNASFEAIFISEKGFCIEQNLRASEMFGYSDKEAVGMFATDIFAEESKSVVKNNVLSGYTKSYDVVALRKNGDTFHAEIQGDNFHESGKLLRITVIRDISNRKKNELELIKAKEKAEESDLLKTEFMNNMSHEINTPMNSILGFSNLLSSNNLTEVKRDSFIRIIQNSSHQLMRIVKDILEISQLETKQVEVNENAVCINDLLLGLFSDFSDKAEKNKTPLYFKKALFNKASKVLSDKAKLNRILSNLLENALKFTHEGFIKLGYQIKGDKLVFFVSDTGIGIRKEKLKVIFKRFSQEEKEMCKNVGGLGLGLSIAKANANLLGGKITVESEKGKGSTFFVTIPYKPIT